MGASQVKGGLVSKVEILPVQAGEGTASGTTDAVPSPQQKGEPQPEARQDFHKKISVSMQEHLEIETQKLGLENGDSQEHVESCNVISYVAGPVPEGISIGKISTNKVAWTEIDTDPNDRLRKNGLPALRQNPCNTVDMLSQWPRPP
ncbi:hypothetical protein M409DRAFT_28023 [Zasmidium cellare ATCC 36951]|uniref:Uncharacterized protein n=1 Tax=Zasmidium cellare ATCC 36951 TaxID=1080233 RepID=A0A6A6C7B9_ZASCE|nr:uncharacterized protein M409DRAFT_28023 [Zasmidium cellare ATCC 36951]KAF2161629.1 hypothetical protein M409DRAFT_28023 [Zasmidium cellare ATCC 36951]